MALWKQIQLGIMWIRDPSLGLAQWVKEGVAISCGVGYRRGPDLVLLWLWHRLAL